MLDKIKNRIHDFVVTMEPKVTWTRKYFGELLSKAAENARASRRKIITDIDLSMVPNYVSYKAALIREKMLLQHGCFILIGLLAVVFLSSRMEISSLQEKLRKKEFILAPGVVDFTSASPQSVSDSYVQYAASDYVATLGNINPTNIEERYKQLSSSMSKDLQIKFQSEAKEWIAKVKAESISEMVTVLGKVIKADDKGGYQAVFRTRTDTFVGSEPIGYRDEAIEMTMSLVAPEQGKKWFLEITALSRTSADAYEKAKELGGK